MSGAIAVPTRFAHKPRPPTIVSRKISYYSVNLTELYQTPVKLNPQFPIRLRRTKIIPATARHCYSRNRRTMFDSQMLAMGNSLLSSPLHAPPATLFASALTDRFRAYVARLAMRAGWLWKDTRNEN